MGYNKQNFKRIREEYATKHLVAEEAAESRRAELHMRLPRVAEIDRALGLTGVRIMGAGLLPTAQREAEIERLHAENDKLLAEREVCLRAAGYPADYSDVKYECEKCGDSGYVGIKMCDCMRNALVLAGFESSGISRLLETQTFESFSLDYYKNDAKVYANMERVLSVMRAYAEGFDPATAQSLALFGGTGLGKTHLSSAVAREVLKKGYDVVYVTALDLVADFEAEQFGARNIARGELTDKYFDCDLLIVDDLGTELVNQFTVSVIYNLLNIRINRKAPTVISTNLGQKELLAKYNDRVTSRIFGEFRPLLFLGADIRMQKIKK
ncbi:MAG: ATP-binding protein [Clostridia bacterium]|nr:ATP-binding protein [Clostridia bacterium]